jgi:polyhydroxyalkanoate synthesis repressor PhaR
MARQEAGAAEILIKRYENRKLYDKDAGRYVTLSDLAKLIGKGREIRVLDQKTGEDLTTLVLAQVILELIKERTSTIPRHVLSALIRWGIKPVEVWKGLPSPQDAASRARSEVERIVSGLLGRGRLTLEEALALRQDVTSSVQRIVSDAQHGLEMRVRGLFEREQRNGGVHPSLHGLKDRLLSFESLLGEPEEEDDRSTKPKAARVKSPRGPKTRRNARKGAGA